MSEETAKKTDLFVLKREAGGEPFKVKIGAKTLTIPHVASVDQFDLAALWATEHENDLAFLSDMFEFLLGDDFETLRGMHLTRPELLNLYRAYNVHCGTIPGESAASPA